MCRCSKINNTMTAKFYFHGPFLLNYMEKIEIWGHKWNPRIEILNQIHSLLYLLIFINYFSSWILHLTVMNRDMPVNIQVLHMFSHPTICTIGEYKSVHVLFDLWLGMWKFRKDENLMHTLLCRFSWWFPKNSFYNFCLCFIQTKLNI